MRFIETRSLNMSKGRAVTEREYDVTRSESEQKAALERSHELSETDRLILEWKDPHQRAMTRRENEALEMFRSDGRARTEFSQEWGQEDHRRWMEERRREEIEKGRVEGRDFGVDVHLRHPDGNSVQLDYVDYKLDVIVDRKPMSSAGSADELAGVYENQRKRHTEAYEHHTGRQVLAYDYALSPSSKELADEERKK